MSPETTTQAYVPHPLLERDELTSAQRRDLLENYVSRGRGLTLEGDRGIIDSHRRRTLNMGQFFTPSRVVKALYQAMGLMNHPAWAAAGVTWSLPEQGSLVDFAGCGNGRMFEFAPKGWTLHGADIDPLACRAARLVYPEAEILEADLLAFRQTGQTKFTAAVINPPFSLTLRNRKPLALTCAQWGILGKDTSAESHMAAVELAARMSSLVGAILPTSALDHDGIKAIQRIMASVHGKGDGIRLRIDLPKEAFRDEGTEWPCSILVLGQIRTKTMTFACESFEEVEEALTAWITSEAQEPANRHWRPSHVLDTLRHHYWRDEKAPTLASWRVQDEPKTARKAPKTPAMATKDAPTIRMALGGRGHQIRLIPNGLVAALAIEEARQWGGWMKGDAFEPQSPLAWSCDLVRNAGNALRSVRSVAGKLGSLEGIQVTCDAQLFAHARRLDRRAWAEMTTHAQWIRKGETWEERGADDSGEDHPAHGLMAGRAATFEPRAQAISSGLSVKGWDREAKAHVSRTWPAFPVYNFSKKDIARALGRRSVIYSAKQGLAKTRFSVGAVLASGVSRAVWVLETRLVNEFRRELRKLGLEHELHLIESKEDLKNLRTINVITYRKLWSPLDGGREQRRTWGPGKSFAAALAKRRPFVIFDEAHKIKTATSKQGIAARLLSQRARRVILLTGTAVQSYARNILGLVVAGWGDGSAINPYGYRRAIQGGYSVPYGKTTRTRDEVIRGVTRFVDEFVDVIWYTPAFEQTASSGMKSREIPHIKDMALWNSFVRPKLIRRVPGEPEVRASGLATPEANPQYIGVEPTKDHFAHYKLVLDHFASIWKSRLERERAGDHSQNNAAFILPELDSLRFASTVPVTRHRWEDKNPLLRYSSRKPTALMLEALRRIAAWVSAGDRVVVGAEKPDALRWLADLLADLPSYVPDSEPIPCALALESNIAKRNAIIDDARDNDDVPVLAISIGMGKEGLNLPEFSKLITLDHCWVPGDLDQYRHRILRPDQAGDPEIVHLHHEGMIDAYMAQLCEAKTSAIAEAIDGQESSYSYDDWKDYRTFALEMLEREGYKFAVDALERERSSSAA